MIELYLVKPGLMTEIPTKSINWTGQRFKSARKITAEVLYTDKGGLKFTKVNEGDTVLFKWKEKELFRGTVFNRNKTKSGTITIIAYDMLHYLLTNKDIYVFSKKRVTDMVVRICKDFQIPRGTIANTGVRLNEIYTNETTLYDIILKGIVNTEKQSGRRFQLSSSKGKLHLKEWKEIEKQWVLETGVNITDYNFATNLDDTATRVKLVSSVDKKTTTAVVNNGSGQKKYGVLQHFERVNEELTQNQANSRAKKLLKQKKGIQKNLEVDALGIDEVVSGMPVYVIEKDLGIKGTYYVDSDTHFFMGDYHDMKLKLLEKNTMAEVD
ncbi:phage portal protein [Lentibacillus sp. N15]|uniref:XkdQ/YqbQ family protein n=1 Tax=Lentibacillus songyuanensis TaxID=3136161 RepID=UPI0031BB89A1